MIDRRGRPLQQNLNSFVPLTQFFLARAEGSKLVRAEVKVRQDINPPLT